MAIQIWQPGDKIKNDRFKILKQLGKGGFGITYLAEDTVKKQQIVIKTLNANQQGEADFAQKQENFVKEGFTLKTFNHPHIVKVYEPIQIGDLWGLVMEYIPGQDLADCIIANGRLGEAEALNYIDQIAQALDCVHQQKFFHRDVKPHNIMLRQDRGEAVLIDFGIAKEFVDFKSIDLTNAYGTPIYQPIEQYERHGKFGPYTDIYALAVTLYHLLTGSAPSPIYASKLRKDAWDKGSGANLDKYLWEELARTGVSKRTQSAIKAGMEIEPSQRPQNITAFCKLLDLRYKQYSIVTSEKRHNRRTMLRWLCGLGGLSGVGSIGLLLKNSRQPPNPMVGISPNPISQNNIKDDLHLETIQFASVKFDNRGEIIARPAKTTKIFKENLGGDVQLTMISIPAGNFMMGSPESEKESESYERPQHQVTLLPFYMGQTLITQAQYKSIMGENPSRFKGSNRPVENVQWNEAQEFCRKLFRKTGRMYTLPSESRWEYACRGGTVSPFYCGDTITTDAANYSGNYSYGNVPVGLYRKETTIVDTFPPNPFGLYDMHGNIWEWCEDTWHENYQGAPTDGSSWDSGNGTYDRLLRGGAWYLKPRFCRSASRSRWSSNVKSNNFGFRVVCSLD